MKLRDQVALVTGAGRGIGKAIALAFATEGAKLALVARTEHELAATAAACQDLGVEARPVVADISSWVDVQALVSAALQINGRIDVLVNNAGVYGPIGLTAEVDVAEWTRAFQINLFGTFHVCRAVLPYMIQQRQGKIINLAGGGATSPLPRFSAYAASKAATVRLTDTLAEEVREFNIQVNAIAPGLVDTQLQDNVLAAGSRAGALHHKIKEARDSGAGAVSPQVAADLVVFLASTASGRLTGKLIAAPHDPWREWAGKADELNATPLYTIRRLDPYTIKPLIKDLV